MLRQIPHSKPHLFRSLWSRLFFPFALIPGIEIIETIFSDSGDRHITISTDGSAILWDKRGQAIAHYLPAKHGYIHNAEFILEDNGFKPRTRILLESTTGIFLINGNGDILTHLKHHIAPTNGIPSKQGFPFIPTLCMSRLTGEQSLWICNLDGKQRRKLGTIHSNIQTIEISPDNQAILTVTENGTTTHWNLHPPKNLSHKPCVCQSCSHHNAIPPSV
jgi:WD40 repeat protein